jgi:hypothetical protein
MNRSPIILICAFCEAFLEDTQVFLEVFRLKARPAMMPSFFIRMFCAAATAGVHDDAFFASLLLRRGAAVGVFARRLGAMVEIRAGDSGLVNMATKEEGLDGMLPSCMPSTPEPLTVLMKGSSCWAVAGVTCRDALQQGPLSS